MRTKATRTEGRPEKERLVEAIKAAREERGMSGRALSAAVGLHPLTIHRFERGDRMLDVLELIDIARALGMDPVELLRAGLGE